MNNNSMNSSKYCATCHPDLLKDQRHAHQKNKSKNGWLTFDKVLPALLGVLVIISTVQTIELSSLKDSITARAQEITPSAVSAPVAQPATQQAASPYGALPSQVGGC